VQACGGGSAPATVTPPVIPPTSTSGLDARPSNTSCLAGDRPSTALSLGVQRVFPNLNFSSPIAMLQAPGSASRWFVLEQGGRVRVFADNAAVTTSTDFVDITARVRSGGEMGLLGMAFHPQFPANPRVYLSYTTGANQLQSRISEFRSTDGGATLDPNSEVVLLTVDQPATNHNGGNINFGPDGFLYIGFGDGGSGGDPFGAIGNGQNLQTLLGKMLRIDVSGATGAVPYRIPAGNPFAANGPCNNGAGAQACPEIYAYGFRNPWRWSFDGGSGELWLADVGQNTWEEVDRVTIGGNYGWRCREGAHAFNSTCGPANNLIDPIAEYGHAVGVSITGGYVYRGTAIPSLAGRYLFGDFSSGRIWHIARDTPPTLTMTSGFDSGLQIASFAQGQGGELYVVNYAGTLHRLTGTGTGSGSVPSVLSASGCVDMQNPARAATNVIPYTPNAEFWSDGASKDRFMALPNAQSIVIGADNDWTLPNNSVLVKNFRLGTRMVETRLLMRHTDGSWAGYTYEWNAAGSEANRVIGGKSAMVNNQTWIYLLCHTSAAGFSLGLETGQLNSSITYAATGRSANQLTTLNAIGVFAPALSGAASTQAVLPNPNEATRTLTERARAYLHTNCSQCHRPGGGTPSTMDLRYTTPLNATNACNLPPQAGNLGIANAQLIAVGDAARSVVVSRGNRRDGFAMPPVASQTVDTAGVQLLSSWINQLTRCD
jgi:uncharacterized repeat protein (TIGR03806 family)